MKIIDFADGIKIIDRKSIYFQSSTPSSQNYLIEYISNQNKLSLQEELDKLESFKVKQQQLNSEKLRGYLEEELDCLVEYDFGIFAHIAGAHDFTISVLYDMTNDRLFLMHPYGSYENSMSIATTDLIELLKKVLLILISFTD